MDIQEGDIDEGRIRREKGEDRWGEYEEGEQKTID